MSPTSGAVPPAATWPLLLLLLGGGCHPAATVDPLPSARRYLDTAAEGQVDAAYAMLSDDFRQRCDRSCYVRLLSSQRTELAQARAQVRTGEARLEMAAELPLSDGTTLKLLQPAEPAQGPYLFSENPLDFYPQDTPEHALRSFMRAAMARRYAALLRFVPKALEEQYTLETLQKRFEGPGRTALQAQLEAIKQHLREPFSFDKDGRSARLPVGEGKEAHLLFEDGRWRISQLE
jgi:hypothetical protein